MRWDDSSVPGADAGPRVWVLGLAGVLRLFQDMPGTGFCLVSSMGTGCGLWAVQCLQCHLSPFGVVRQKRGDITPLTP
jgi:hypothetical protein